MIASEGREERLISSIGRILSVGVATSSVFLAAGLIWSSVAPESMVAGTLMSVGLWILMATPVTRVAASVFGYAIQRDWLFVVLTTLVLLEIVGGVIAALVFHRHL